jgi:hypothetical protein
MREHGNSLVGNGTWQEGRVKLGFLFAGRRRRAGRLFPDFSPVLCANKQAGDKWR